MIAFGNNNLVDFFKMISKEKPLDSHSQVGVALGKTDKTCRHNEQQNFRVD